MGVSIPSSSTTIFSSSSEPNLALYLLTFPSCDIALPRPSHHAGDGDRAWRGSASLSSSHHAGDGDLEAVKRGGGAGDAERPPLTAWTGICVGNEEEECNIEGSSVGALI